MPAPLAGALYGMFGSGAAGALSKGLPNHGPNGGFSGIFNQLGTQFRDNIAAKADAGAYGEDRKLPMSFNFPKGYPGGREQAFTTLQEILGLQGKSDPALMNRDLAGIQRGTQMTQDTARSEQARMGLEGSGLMQALQGALGQSGEDRKAGRMAQETAAEEERKRQDLMLWLQMLVNPALDAKSINAGISASNRQYDSQQNAALLGALGQLGGSVMGNWGFWNKGGGTSPTSTAQNNANFGFQNPVM